jgi:hypothetical protein
MLLSADWELFKTVVPVREQVIACTISDNCLSTYAHTSGLRAEWNDLATLAR